METRRQERVWLVGVLRSETLASSTQLPTCGDVLRRLLFFVRKQKLSTAEAANVTTDEVMNVWSRASIPTSHKPKCVERVKALSKEMENVSRNQNRRGEAQVKRENAFEKKLTTLFDTAHANALEQIAVAEDKEFLRDQRGERKRYIGKEDTNYGRKVAEKEKRRAAEEKRRKRSHQEMVLAMETETLERSSSSESIDTDDVDADVPITSTSAGPPPTVRSLPAKRLLQSPTFTAALDRTNTSLRKAMHIVAPALAAAGVELKSVTLSRSSLHRSRHQLRKDLSAEIKENFRPETPLIVHFDGKFLSDADGGKSDRLAVVVSGVGTEKLLGIPKIPESSGQSMATAILKLLEDWPQVLPCVTGLCFDTTAANTGIHSGACTFLQAQLDRRILFLAYRHHSMELVKPFLIVFVRVSLSQIATSKPE